MSVNRKRLLLILALAFGLVRASARQAQAQALPDTLADALRQRLSHEEVILHNFSAQPVVHARFDGSAFSLDPSLVKSFSLMKFSEVSASTQGVTLKGTKRYLLRRAGKLAPLAEVEPVTVVIDVDQSAPRSSVPVDQSKLFFDDVGTALASVTAAASEVVPGNVEPALKIPSPNAVCDCSQHGTDACRAGASEKGAAPPVLVKQVAPRAPGDLPSPAQTSAAIRIDNGGNVQDIWMLHAASAGLASASFAALKQYRFKPATCHGSPVESYLIVDTRYRP